jgi:peptidyl-tRNA hydrolase, PTH1 family
MKLVIGLGNPGSEYVGTRHNVGFDVVERVAERLGWIKPGEFNRQAKSSFDGLVIDGVVSLHSTGGTDKLVLIKPMTYMNESGRCAAAAMNFFKLTPAEVIIIVDELALPCGQIRLKPDGSDGGHNGLKSVQQMLGTNRYPRLRIGVDQPPAFIPGRDYVLGRFSPDQKPKVDGALNRACGCVMTWADEGLTRAMNQFNVKEPTADNRRPSTD